MGTSEESPDGADVDSSAGTIVWVRRRNGSWWPGRILGSEELSSSNLMSPRSGTPVKLLGRDDASVDWYNLEKSKRVKAFRCGEFDDCIERAESSQSIPLKKREKYARREDAILHALELEKQQGETKQTGIGLTSSHSIGEEKSPLDTDLVYKGAINSFRFMEQRLQTPSSGSDSSSGEQSPDSTMSCQNEKEKMQDPSCKDNAEGVPRMRGLQDFGLRIVPPKKKIAVADSLNGYQEYLFHNHGSIRNNSGSKKRKPHGGSNDELLVRRRDRRRPLHQVLQSSARLPSCPSLLSNGDNASTLLQSERKQVGVVCRAKRSKCIYLPAEPDGCFQMDMPSQTVRKSGEESMHHGSSGSSEEDSTNIPRGHSDTKTGLLFSGSSQAQRMDRGAIHSMGRSEIARPDYSSLYDCRPQLHMQQSATGFSACMDGSKWQLKGKRNIRNLNKKHFEGRPGSCDVRRYSFMLNQNKGDSHGGTDSDEDTQMALRGYWEEPNEHFNPFCAGHLGSGLDSPLIDVDLKVQESYQRERVPLVSLMSRLNGKAIVGHPLQIEVLHDGTSSLACGDAADVDTAICDGNASLPPVWRTARRTTMHRLPRHPPSSELDDDVVEALQCCEPESAHRHHSSLVINQTKVMKRGQSDLHHQLEEKPSRKMTKQINLSALKTRTLSSFGVGKKPQKHNPTYGRNALIKASVTASPSCIPVKLVFRRIHEAVGNPQSAARKRPL